MFCNDENRSGMLCRAVILFLMFRSSIAQQCLLDLTLTGFYTDEDLTECLETETLCNDPVYDGFGGGCSYLGRTFSEDFLPRPDLDPTATCTPRLGCLECFIANELGNIDCRVPGTDATMRKSLVSDPTECSEACGLDEECFIACILPCYGQCGADPDSECLQTCVLSTEFTIEYVKCAMPDCAATCCRMEDGPTNDCPLRYPQGCPAGYGNNFADTTCTGSACDVFQCCDLVDPTVDTDADGLMDAVDNCPEIFNPNQDPAACSVTEKDGCPSAYDACTVDQAVQTTNRILVPIAAVLASISAAASCIDQFKGPVGEKQEGLISRLAKVFMIVSALTLALAYFFLGQDTSDYPFEIPCDVAGALYFAGIWTFLIANLYAAYCLTRALVWESQVIHASPDPLSHNEVPSRSDMGADVVDIDGPYDRPYNGQRSATGPGRTDLATWISNRRLQRKAKWTERRRHSHIGLPILLVLIVIATVLVVGIDETGWPAQHPGPFAYSVCYYPEGAVVEIGLILPLFVSAAVGLVLVVYNGYKLYYFTRNADAELKMDSLRRAYVVEWTNQVCGVLILLLWAVISVDMVRYAPWSVTAVAIVSIIGFTLTLIRMCLDPKGTVFGLFPLVGDVMDLDGRTGIRKGKVKIEKEAAEAAAKLEQK